MKRNNRKGVGNAFYYGGITKRTTISIDLKTLTKINKIKEKKESLSHIIVKLLRESPRIASQNDVEVGN